MNTKIIPKDNDILYTNECMLRLSKIDIKPYSNHRYFISLNKNIKPNSYFNESDIKKIFLEKIYKKK